MIMLNISHPYRPLSAAGLRNPHRHRVSLACAAKRGSQQPAQQPSKPPARQPASLSKKAEELMQAAVVVAAQQSAGGATEKTVAELRHIHSGVDKVIDELSVLKGAARVQRLQMARLVLGPHLESSSSYGSYQRFRHPRLMDRILEEVLRNAQQPIRLELDHPGCHHEVSRFNAETLEVELEGLTGWTWKAYEGEDDNWYVEFEE